MIRSWTAKSCEEAEDLLETFAFDLVLMDCRLPEKSGIECAIMIREGSTRTKNVPIIAFTADVTEENRAQCREAGMKDFLPKPFTLPELQDKIFAWLKPKER